MDIEIYKEFYPEYAPGQKVAVKVSDGELETIIRSCVFQGIVKDGKWMLVCIGYTVMHHLTFDRLYKKSGGVVPPYNILKKLD